MERFIIKGFLNSFMVYRREIGVFALLVSIIFFIGVVEAGSWSPSLKGCCSDNCIIVDSQSCSSVNNFFYKVECNDVTSCANDCKVTGACDFDLCPENCGDVGDSCVNYDGCTKGTCGYDSSGKSKVTIFEDGTCWVRGVGCVSDSEKCSKLENEYSKYLSSLNGCCFTREGDKEYLNWDAMIKVLREVEGGENAYKTSAAIMFTYYEGSFGTEELFPHLKLIQDFMKSRKKIILTHPEFFSSDTGVTSQYGFLLDNEACLIKKVYLKGQLISLSHIAGSAVSVGDLGSLAFSSGGLWFGGLNLQNFNGDLLGYYLKKRILSSILTGEKLSSILSNLFPLLPKQLFDEGSNYYSSGGGW